VGGAALAPEPLAVRLGLGPCRIGTGAVAVGALGLLALSHALEGALRLAQMGTSPTLARFADAVSGLGPGALLLPLVSFAGVAAAAEELLFRGFLQRGLESAIGVLPAVALAALAFGAAHADLVQGSAALVLGIYLGLLAHAADSIRASIAAHALNNAAAVVEAATGLALPSAGPGAWLSIAAGGVLAGVALRTVWRAARRRSSSSGPAAGGSPHAEAGPGPA